MLVNVLNIAMTVVAISLLIIVHELGHFILAKAVGMRVEVFSVGFWKRIVGFKVGDTDYRLCLVPLGGYVKVAGESPDAAEGGEDEFWSKSCGQRALFIVGGVVMNFLFAIALFIAAFATGVPFAVARVEGVRHGGAAWEAGILPGDKIVAVGDKRNPVFEDVSRAVMFSTAGETVRLKVQRDGQDKPFFFAIEPRYDEQLGLRTIGIMPPYEPLVTSFAELKWGDESSPAREAGIELRDRIVAVNGVEVATEQDVGEQLKRSGEGAVEITVERNGERLEIEVEPRPFKAPRIGISGANTRVEALQGGGMAAEIGLKAGDVVKAVNGADVASGFELGQALLPAAGGRAVLDVERDGRAMQFAVDLSDVQRLAEFLFSVKFRADTTLDWVAEDGPAWRAGLRPGDTVRTVAGEEVTTWDEVLIEVRWLWRWRRWRGKPFKIEYERDGKVIETETTAELMADEPQLFLGTGFERPVMITSREAPLSAVARGVGNSVRTMAEIVVTIQRFVSRDVSTRNLGGIVTIARVSYWAAAQGIGKLLYLTAIISASLAFLNLLPIPVLDGGHLLFLAIEKVRGRRLSDKTLMITQSIGFALLLMLVVYVTRNDIRNLMGL